MSRTLLPRGLRVALAVLVLPLFATPVSAQVLRQAGIEIGGKGVKATVVEVTPTAADPVKVLLAKTANTALTDLGGDKKFRPDAITATAAAITGLLAEIENDHRVPRDRVAVIGSSGVKNAADTVELAAEVKKVTGKDLTFITPEKEAELTLAGLALLGPARDALLIDVGSGNTKGGVFAGGRFVPFALNLGTLTYTTRVKAAAAGGSFFDTAKRIAPEEVQKYLEAGAAKAPELTTRPSAFLTGGVCWAVATFAHPELARAPFVPVTAADVDRFIAAVAKAGELPDPDVAAMAEDAKEAALSDAKRVRATYTGENLVAGATILRAAFAAFKLEGKTAYFARQGATAWILASVAPAELQAPAPKPDTPGTTPAPKTTTPSLQPGAAPPALRGPTPAGGIVRPPDPLPMGWYTYPPPTVWYTPYPVMPAYSYPGYAPAVAMPPRAVWGPSMYPPPYYAPSPYPAFGTGYPTYHPYAVYRTPWVGW